MSDEEILATFDEGVRMSHMAHAKRIEFDLKMALARAERLVAPGQDIDVFGDGTVKEESLCAKFPQRVEHGDDDPGDGAR